MSKISITYKFELENGEEDKIVINNVAESATDVEIGALADEILSGNTKLKGQKLLSLKSCKKVTTTEEDLYF